MLSLQHRLRSTDKVELEATAAALEATLAATISKIGRITEASNAQRLSLAQKVLAVTVLLAVKAVTDAYYSTTKEVVRWTNLNFTTGKKLAKKSIHS